jgi:hypothetical protein
MKGKFPKGNTKKRRRKRQKKETQITYKKPLQKVT